MFLVDDIFCEEVGPRSNPLQRPSARWGVAQTRSLVGVYMTQGRKTDDESDSSEAACVKNFNFLRSVARAGVKCRQSDNLTVAYSFHNSFHNCCCGSTTAGSFVRALVTRVGKPRVSRRQRTTLFLGRGQCFSHEARVCFEEEKGACSGGWVTPLSLCLRCRESAWTETDVGMSIRHKTTEHVGDHRTQPSKLVRAEIDTQVGLPCSMAPDLGGLNNVKRATSLSEEVCSTQRNERRLDRKTNE